MANLPFPKRTSRAPNRRTSQSEQENLNTFPHRRDMPFCRRHRDAARILMHEHMTWGRMPWTCTIKEQLRR